MQYMTLEAIARKRTHQILYLKITRVCVNTAVQPCVCTSACTELFFWILFSASVELVQNTFLQLGWTREVWGMWVLLLRRDDVIKNRSRKNLHERICMSVYCVPFPRLRCLVVSLTQAEKTSLKLCCLCFTHPALGMPGFDSCAEHEQSAKTGFPWEAVTSCSFAVTCYEVANADAHSWPVPLWFLPLLRGRNTVLLTQLSGVTGSSEMLLLSFLRLDPCPHCVHHKLVEPRSSAVTKKMMARRNPQINIYCQPKKSKMHLFSHCLYVELIFLAGTVNKESEQIRCGSIFGVSAGLAFF